MNDQKQHTQNDGTTHAEDTSHHEASKPEPSPYKTPQQLAEEVLGKIDWSDEITGYLDCPGKVKHTTLDGRCDCRIRVDGTPTLFCLHEHCEPDIKEANDLLRAAFNANLVRSPSSSKASGMPVWPPSGEVEELSRKAARALPNILRNYAWTLSEIRQDSPVKLADITGEEWRYYLVLYELDDVLWIGNTHESGSKAYAGCWKSVVERLRNFSNKTPGPFICTSTFRQGTYERKKENVIEHKFLVVEFDRIDETVEAKLAAKEPLSADDIIRNKTKSAAVFRWLKDAVGLRLRAIVDSGNKSLHAHFAMPPADVLAELEVILPALKCDPATFRPTQPVRMPGYCATDGTGRQQPLLYLDRDEKEHPPCRLPSAVLTLIDDELIHTGRPIGNVFTTEGDASLFTAEARDDHGVDVCPASNSSASYGCADSTTGEGNDVVTSSISYDPDPEITSAVPDSASFSSNSLPRDSPPPKMHAASSSFSSNSSRQASAPSPPGATTSFNSSPPPMDWPNSLAPAAFHGIAGEIVGMIEPHTEADPAALLIHLLAGVGNIIGRNSFITADGSNHYLNLFVAIVGATSKGRKGTSWNQIARLLEKVDEGWKKDRVSSQLASGEGIVTQVRDPVMETKAAKGPGVMPGEVDTVIKQEGVSDKRLFLIESELAGAFEVMERKGNTLSPVMRNAWDGVAIGSLVKNNRERCTEPHISIVGHITKEELLLKMRAVEMANGFANRFLWIATQRSKSLPEGGDIDRVDFSSVIMRLRAIIDFAKTCGQIRRSDSARDLWWAVYPSLSEGKPGIVGAITGRAEAQVMRLSALYAIFDQSKLIEPKHHEAAMAVWRYSEETVRWIIGNKTGDKDADKILSALKKAGAEGLSRSDIWKNVFKNNKSAHDLDEALQKLVKYNFAESRVKGAAEQWFVKNEVRI